MRPKQTQGNRVFQMYATRLVSAGGPFIIRAFLYTAHRLSKNNPTKTLPYTLYKNKQQLTF